MSAVVATVTDDARVHEIPAGLRVAALRFTEGARARIVAVSECCCVGVWVGGLVGWAFVVYGLLKGGDAHQAGR